jgi:hypothetical protein
MFSIARTRPWPPDIDLANARETIAYIEGDMRRIPELERVADALSAAMTEIDVAERAVPCAPNLTTFASRFIPRR